MKSRTIALTLVAALLGAPAVCCAAGAAKLFEKGGVRLYGNKKDKNDSRIEMDGRFCLSEGPIELLGCATGGKEYESILALDVNPEMLHLCLLMMGCRPGKTGPRRQGDPDIAPTGSPILVTVRWKVAGNDVVHRAEDLCWNVIDKRPMVRTHWVFSGSRVQYDVDAQTGKKRRLYVANVEKTLIAVYRDPFAVLDLPLALGANDDAYVVNKELVPKTDTPCTVVLKRGAEPAPEKNARGGRILHVDVTGGGRVLINNLDLGDPTPALKTIAAYAPRDTCRITVDHGPTSAEHVPSTAAAAAKAFEAVAAAAIPIESVETTRTAAGVRELATLTVVGVELRVDGKAASDEDAARAVRERLKNAKNGGVTVAVENAASLAAVVRALRACDGAEGGHLRIAWRRATPPLPPVPAVSRPKNDGGGSVFPVEIHANGDVRIAGLETIDPAQTFRIIGTYAPRDSCAVTVDHGAPPAVVAQTLGGVVRARNGIESLRMTRVRADVKDAVTIVVERDDIRIDGTKLADVKSAKQVIYTRITGAKDGKGVVVQVNKDASLHGIEKALEACEGAKAAVLRIVWQDK